MRAPHLPCADAGKKATLGAPAFVLAFAIMMILALAIPTPVPAQALAPADLFGSWARKDNRENHLILRADGTITKTVAMEDSDLGTMLGEISGNWSLIGDTLAPSGLIFKGQSSMGELTSGVTPPTYVVTLKGQELTLTDTADQKVEVYERLAPAKASSPAGLP